MLTYKQEQGSLRRPNEGLAADETRMGSFRTALSVIDHDFPLEFLIAGELAQFETYAIPSISRLLHQTGQYEKEGLKRLDDTRATMYGIFTNPDGSEERSKMLDHLNWVHSHYEISNEDALYTLLRMFFNPIEWIQRWGWRQLSANEVKAMTDEMITIGKGMNIEFAFETFEELYAWQEAYRQEKQCYSRENEQVTLGTIEGIKEHFPGYLQPIFSVLIRCYLKDSNLLEALGLKETNRVQRSLASIPLVMWKYANKLYRPWGKRPFSKGWLANYYPSYENNQLDCCRLGPGKLIQHRNKKSGCPFH